MAAHEVPVEHAELLGVAVELAHLTGALIRDGREAAGADLEVDTKTTPTDLVTAVDKQAEQFLVEQLHERRPGDAVLGEEGADQSGSTGVRWLIDPIDGTVNFYYGVPQYAVSVAAEYDGQTVAGAVHNPVSGETFMALRGVGAWLGSRQLSTPGRAASLETALIGTGF